MNKTINKIPLVKISAFALCLFSFSIIADASKPAVTILATGGTIAGSSASESDTANYTVGELSVESLIKAVPALNDIAVITGEQVANVDSNDISLSTLLTLQQKISQLLDNSSQSGVVVTHGTDTLEETAFFLDLTLKTKKPVVIVGAMRPATALSADGPMNLLQAVTLAASPQAWSRGVMEVSNDRIASGFYVTKTNPTSLDTFKAPEQGYLGTFVNGKPQFWYSAATPTNKPWFDIQGLQQLPKVVIIYSYQGIDADLLSSAMRNGAKGIVIAAAGNGTLPKALQQSVADMMKKGIPVILASKALPNFVTPKTLGIGSGAYNPVKARILLSLALAKKASMEQIRHYFED
ncbi:MAG: type II asparaginase [Enterobacteriaceae bacterium]